MFEVSKKNDEWKLTEKKAVQGIRCLASDPSKKGRLYGGTFDHGLWISDDFGDSWYAAGSGIKHNRVLSVAVSNVDIKNGYHIVWAGTEPSGLFCSEDGGKSWSERPALLELPSKSTWSFPPRPYTHHVRSIQPDLHQKNQLFVGIELGGVMKSEDKGNTWEDRKPGSEHDCHTLTMSAKQKNRIYEAAGGGFSESHDGGNTWETINTGLGDYTYLVNIAVDSANPDTIIASAAKNARTAYMPERASTVLVRRAYGEQWEIVQNGLPDADGASVFALAADDSTSGTFYAVNNTGVYQSIDSGKTWSNLPVKWPKSLLDERIFDLVLLDGQSITE